MIELLVVISIIGILASFAIASFNSAQQKGRDAKRKADLDALQKALELYKGDTTGGANYPLALTSLTASTYIKSIPTDPNPTTRGYSYLATATIAYTMTACLENKNDPQRDTAATATGCTQASYTLNNP